MRTETPIRVLFIHHSGHAAGGAERSLFELATSLKALGVDVRVMLPATGTLGGYLSAAGIPVFHARLHALSRSKNSFRQARFLLSLVRTRFQIRRLVRRDGIDIVHGNSTSAAVYAAWALGNREGGCRLLNPSRKEERVSVESECPRTTHNLSVPASRQSHGSRTHAGRAPAALVWHCRDRVELGRLGDWLGRRMSAVIAISAGVRRGLAGHVAADRLVVIPNGVDKRRLETGASREAFRQHLRIPQDAPAIGMAAHLAPWKNHELFLRAGQEVVAQIPAAHFVIAGGEPEGLVSGHQQELLNLAAGLGLATQTYFLGNYADMGAFYRGIDILCHPVEKEPFGRVVAEAMMLGVPVVGVPDSGPAEFIESGKTGIIAESATVAAVGEALAQLLKAPDKRQKLGGAVAAYARENLDISLAASRVADFYKNWDF